MQDKNSQPDETTPLYILINKRKKYIVTSKFSSLKYYPTFWGLTSKERKIE